MLVDEMPAGREMDALIATKVFRCSHVIRHISGWICQDTGQALPAYSEDITAAWEVVEHLRQHCGLVFFGLEANFHFSFWKAGLSILPPDYDPSREEGFGIWPYRAKKCDTAPLAICRAALKTVGVTEV